MKDLAIDYHGSRTFKERASPSPPPGPSEVQLAVAFTGICGTDLKIAEGYMDHRITSPWPIGHEMSGTVVGVGSDVTEWHAGDNVTVMPLDWCGKCPACSQGHNHVCHELNFVGIDSPGSLQRRWNVKASLLVAIPASLPLRHAALVEPAAVAVHDVRRGRVGASDCVVVIGGGPIGLLIALVARHAGADVLLSEIAPSRVAIARELGFQVIDPFLDDIGHRVDEWTGGKGADVAFEVSGSAAGVKTMTNVLAVRGRGVVVAIHPEPVPVDLFQLFWKELEIFGARVYERSDFEAAITLLDSQVIPAERLITEVVPLEETASAIARLASGEDIFKLLVASQ